MGPNYLEIGKRLQEARKLNNLTQQALSDCLDFSLSYIKNTERGKKPSIEYLFTVADKCQVPLEWLLTGNQQIQNNAPEIEVIFDPDLKRMVDILKELMANENPHMKGWAIIQFEKAFSEFCATYDEKNQQAY